MYKKTTILAKKVPYWLLAIILIVSGAGAAVGTVLSGGVIGEINISTTGSAGGLMIGAPICDYIEHTPNEVRDSTGGIGPYADATEIGEDNYGPLAFSDNIYHVTTGAAAIPQQLFQFYVGPDASEITKLVFNWEGSSNVAVTNAVQVYKTLIGWTNLVGAGSRDDIVTTDATNTITFTSITTPKISELVDSGYVYLSVKGTTGSILSTDYVTATAYYSAIDLDNWTGFSGPSFGQKEFTVPGRCVGVRGDNQVTFEAAAEVAVGDWWLFALPINNAGDQTITAKLTLTAPSCINVYALTPDELADFDPRVHHITQIAVNTWKLIVDSDAAGQDGDDYVYIAVNAHDDCGPENWLVDAELIQIPY